MGLPVQRPTLKTLLRFPVTTGTGILAVIATGAWAKTGLDLSPLIMDDFWWRGRLWQPVTSVFLHLDFWHLVFNVYWLYLLGGFLETRLGQWRVAGIYLLLAVGSSLAQFAFDDAGVGLSGLGYGVFALLLVLERRDSRFVGALSRDTIVLFAAWFIFCIAATRFGWMRVGNVAHGSGALLGLVLGLAMVTRGRARSAAVATAVALVLACAGLASVGREYVNMAPPDAAREAYRGYLAATGGRTEEAVRLFQKAVDLDRGNPDYWYSLGAALHRLDRMNEAADAYRKAHELDPSQADWAKVLESTVSRLGYSAHVAGDWEGAIRLYQEALSLDSTDGTTWENLARAYESLGKEANASDAHWMAKQAARPAGETRRFPE